jgi:hypothetical protein
MSALLTPERLREVLDYDQETGQFTWRIQMGRHVKAGKVVRNRPNSNGYIRIKIDRVLYAAHRLAWLHVTGEWPTHEVDHKNGTRSDNKFKNLRDVPHKVNAQNRVRASRASRVGVAGVSARGGRFRARIRVDGVLKSLGSHGTTDAAHMAFLQVKRAEHPGCTV